MEMIDVSMWQGKIDWQKVKKSGIGMAYVKATEGQSWIDPRFEENISGATAVGIAVGAYHFARPGQGNVDNEASHFLETIRGKNLSLRPVLDIETNSGLTTSELLAWATKWLEMVEHETGMRPIVYTGEWFRSQYLSSLSGYDFWIAKYSIQPPQPPYIAWQYTQSGRIEGINGNVDMSRVADENVIRERAKMNQQDAQKIIGILGAVWNMLPPGPGRDEVHRLANEVRKAAGMPVQE